MLNVDASEDESRIRLPRWLITDRTFLIVWITDPTFFNLLTLDHGSGSIGPKCCGRCTAGKELLIFKYLITSKQ
jgi:hypothetical protein